MKRKEDNFPINDDYLSNGEIDDEMMDDEGPCEVFDAVLALASMPKPFGLLWDNSKVEKFLQARGYKILNQKIPGRGKDTYKVAVKPDESVIPDQPNLRDVFEEELQDIILSWLLKISK